jgi:hypothetical protein
MMKKVMIIVALTVMFSSAGWGAVIVDDHFDDGNVGTNTNGIGSGFNGGDWLTTESNSRVRFNGLAGWAQPRITSKEGVALGTETASFQFLGVSFAKNVENTGTGSTDRLYLGVKGIDTSNEMHGNPDTGFWIQIESDSVLTAGGNGRWTGTSTLFYESSANARTSLGSWTFDTLNWDDNDPLTMNFSPVLDFVLDLGSDGYALTISGDTISFLTGSLSGTYAAAGITNELMMGYAAVHNQGEAPGIDAYVDRIVVTGIPEPATLALLGLGALVSLRKRN